jgi:hypothetical protein
LARAAAISEEEIMRLFALRLRDGNCLIIAGNSEADALHRAQALRRDSNIVSCREMENFAAEFVLGDEGDLKTVLQDAGTLAELRAFEYPMLDAAINQSYADFNSSATDSRTEPVLFDSHARDHVAGWDERDRDIVRFSVDQERQRFSH